MKNVLAILKFGFAMLIATSCFGQKKELTFQTSFQLSDLNKIELDIDSSDWETVLKSTNYLVNSTMRINEGFAIPIRVARKGNSSNNNTLDRDKIPLKIDGPGSFNLKLNNNYRDYTMGAREYIGYKLHEEFTGIGSSIAATEVYVNGSFYGMYLAVEDLNRRFYDNNLGGITQRIKASPTFKPVYDGKPYSNLYWLGENPAHYEGRYEIKKGSIEELIDLIDIINNNPDKAYLHIDIEQVCRFLAVENYLMNVDGIIGEVYSHNYELVKRADDGKWQLVPWDLNLALGAWSKPSISNKKKTIDILTQLPLNSGSTNNALIGLVMNEYFFLYNYYYRQLIENWDDERIIAWAQNYEKIIKKSDQKDEKLYDGSLVDKAYVENINTTDGYATALIPTIQKRYEYIKRLSLDKKFSNKIEQVDIHQDTVMIHLSEQVKNGPVVMVYLDSKRELKRLRAMPLNRATNIYYCIMPDEAKTFHVYTLHNGIKYDYPYNGLLGQLNATVPPNME